MHRTPASAFFLQAELASLARCDPSALPLVAWLLGAVAAAAQTQSNLEDLKRLSIEELAETDVTGFGRCG